MPNWYWKKGDEFHWEYMLQKVKQFLNAQQRLPNKNDTEKEIKYLWTWIQK